MTPDFLIIPNLVDRSDAVAEFWHRGQYRFDGVTPYIVHPRAVAASVKGLLEKQVANLHDSLEDTECTTIDLFYYGFSVEVVEAVVVLTKKDGQTYEDYLALVKANPLAKAVKIADMLANLNDTPTKNQVKKYAKGLQFLLT